MARTGVRGRVAGRATVGSRQRPHTERSRKAAEELAQAVWAEVERRQRKEEGVR